MKMSELAVLAFICLIGTAEAQTVGNTPTEKGIWNAACAQVGEVAQSIITLRLDDTPMSTMMKRLDDTVGAGQDEYSRRYAEFLRSLVVKAYKGPAYKTEELRKATIAQFRNEAELACYSGGI